jgi:thiamine-monophosphate kinase
MPKLNNSSFGEFALIQKFFTRHQENPQKNLLLGVGDDCALLRSPAAGSVLAITTDMLVENRHFFAEVDPKTLGHKALAVNLSDLAAMGAQPTAFTLSLALNNNDPDWLLEFSNGLYELADQFKCQLIGGDTTAGPLTINITAIGEVPPNLALRRGNAQAGDDIWVSHEIGDARWALGHLRGEWQMNDDAFAQARLRLDKPTPRVQLGIQLRSLAHAAIDISDGLLGDLQHILEASHLDATVWVDNIPVSDNLAQESMERRRLCSLKGGDDYELCFTAKPENRLAIDSLSQALRLKLTRIGMTHQINDKREATPLMSLIDANGQILSPELATQYLQSFDHFK